MKKIQLNTAGFTPFEDENYQYILAGNGLFLGKRNAAFTATVPVDPTTEFGLQPLETTMHLHPNIRLTASVIHPAIAFFRTVFERYGTESLLLILLDPETDEVTLGCPRQQNNTGWVHAEDDASIPDHLLRIGTIHTHPGSSFHSEGDIDDEAHRDGLHIVIGNLDRPVPDFTASLVVKGHRKELDPNEVMELQLAFDESWLDQIHVVRRWGHSYSVSTRSLWCSAWAGAGARPET